MMFAPKKILVPTNLSEPSDAALKEAIDIACQYNSRIYLLHVMDDNIARRLVYPGLCGEDLVERIKSMRAAYLEDMIRRQRDAYLPARDIEIVPAVETGFPTDVILKEQKEKGIDLVVLGSRKRPGMIGRFLGNVAEKVMRSASFHALVVSY